MVTDAWTAGSGRWVLSSQLPPLPTRSESPVSTLSDLFIELSVTWDTPVPYLVYTFEVGFEPAARTEEAVDLKRRQLCHRLAKLPHVSR